MRKNFTYMSVLTTDDYLPGIIVLSQSLLNTETQYPFLVLVTPNVSIATTSALDSFGIKYKLLDDNLDNPTDVDKKHRWFATYPKLFIFNQTEYEKIVYLDADMLILRNIDKLFDKPHMSATNAGGMLPRKQSWKHMNSGLMVIEPSRNLFEDMINKIGKIEKLESGGTPQKPQYGSDQDFLNAYYPEWPNKKELQMDHMFNIFHYYAKEYMELFGYSIDSNNKPIMVMHYASYLKPWNITKTALQEHEKDENRSVEAITIQMWLKEYRNTIKRFK